ncbi:hypothetical protein [Rubripirellula reticaptiva]|uniref:Uncharacterized protein n=1 Tax=Rubripirellula reticaptiva TaxID=2528013 RepID=A0A5C6E997_9BACT|nr:hypothetical protein [Rubripirellula reticaptiva]TWU44477.1 hypothetical protein Poly59_61490 [Rubripirellula reticaptiva]
MKLLLSFSTKAGTFYIGQSNDGRFHPIYNDESLGSYAKHWQATEDLATNATFSVLHSTTGELLDTSRLGIPEDPSEWERIR